MDEADQHDVAIFVGVKALAAGMAFVMIATALGVAPVDVHFALFFVLPVAALFTGIALLSQRRIDSVFARAVACDLAEGRDLPEDFKEAA